MTITEYKPGDIVLFTDTGREHLKTYEFINNFEKNENIPVVKIRYKNADDPYRQYLIDKNFFLPSIVMRTCTTDLKITTARRWLKQNNILQYENLIGFRYDEQQRVINYKQNRKKVITKFPLYENKIDKQKVNAFWKNKNYTLEIPSILGNCTLCFLKGKNAIISILISYPELAEKWIEDEKLAKNSKYNKTYLKDVSIETMLKIAQSNLFKNKNLDLINPTFNCNCTT